MGGSEEGGGQPFPGRDSPRHSSTPPGPWTDESSAAHRLLQHPPAPAPIPAQATSSAPARAKQMLKKTERVERRSTGQAREHEVYPRSHGLSEHSPHIPPTRTPGSRDPNPLLHRDRGTTAEAPPAHPGETQQRAAEVGQAQTGGKGRFLTGRLTADTPQGRALCSESRCSAAHRREPRHARARPRRLHPRQ